jgi:hypothetical protein
MIESAPLHRAASRGVTLPEVLVACGCVLVLCAAAPVLLDDGKDRAMVAQSVSNLKNLASANETYAGDWGDRQWTAIRDDAGAVAGDCGRYIAEIGCPPQLILGWDTAGMMWGYFLGNGGKCAASGFPGSCDAWAAYVPIAFDGEHAGFGAFRLPNAKLFHDYVNGRFYDPTFYAPKDAKPRERIAAYLAAADEFRFDGTAFELSSYCFSPAAMYDTKVLAAAGFTDPKTFQTAYRSPPVSRCKYPALKTRMIEHNWLQNAPTIDANPGFVGNATPWFFSHGVESAPVSLFFDGHIEVIGMARAMADDARMKDAKLWSRATPLGAAGYFGAQAFDRFVETGFHVLTADGIEGRDIVSAGASETNALAPKSPLLQEPGSTVKIGGMGTESKAPKTAD